MTDVTRILDAAARGDAGAAEQILPLVYDELRQLAERQLAKEFPGQTLQPTALVHEAYVRLIGPGGADAAGAAQPGWKGRGHFFGAAAEAMRRILIENARRKKRLRHGGGRRRVALEGHDVAAERPPEELLELDEALTRLAAEDADAAEVVKLRFYAGLSIEDAAEALGMSRASAYRHWTYARAWLRAALHEENPPAE